MMTYEIILTDACTRNCAFCYVKKTGYTESIENIEKFIGIVRTEQSVQDEPYAINLFGGEPLLNKAGIERIAGEFKNDNCNITVYTNADLLDESSIIRQENLFYRITAYDFFNDRHRYEALIEKIGKPQCSLSYTFTQADIDLLQSFVDYCHETGVNYHVNISHDPGSWKYLNANILYKKLYAVYNSIMGYYIDSHCYPTLFEKYFMRCVSFLFNADLQEVFCSTFPKKVFYRGKFIGHCIRFDGKNAEKTYALKRCQYCIYKKVCQKSCIAEYVDGDIPEKLCIIEKAMLDAIFQTIRKRIHESGLRYIIKRYFMNKIFKHI